MDAIIELYKELSPTSAYGQGITSCKNKLFIPSKKNRADAIRKIDVLLRNCKKKKERIILGSMKTELELFQPVHFIKEIGPCLFIYSIKKTPLDKIMNEIKTGMHVLIDEYTDMPTGIKILCARGIDSTIAGTETISKDTEIVSLLRIYQKKLALDFTVDKENILKQISSNSLDRKKTYAKSLKKYNIRESPKEIENSCVNWMHQTIPEFNAVVNKIKKEYRLKDIASIDNFLLVKSKPDSLKTARKWRKTLAPLIEKNIVSISPKHRVNLIETPKHLQTMISVAGAMPINTMGGKFDNILFLTKEAKVNDFFLVDVMIHEEYGHNLNFSNSLGAEEIDRLYFIPTTFTTAEVVASYIEYRFFELSKKLSLDPEFKLLYTYVILRRFLIIYLRAIGDMRINTGKSSLAEFIDWANKKTGVDKDFLFNEMMSKLYSPGYSTAYPLGIHALEALRQQSKMTEKEFNTKVWSLGLPPLEIFLEMIRKLH